MQSVREEDFKTGRYRAMAVNRVRAAADAEGPPTAYHQQIVAEPTSTNCRSSVTSCSPTGVDFFTTTGAADPPYTFENFKLESTNFQSGVPTMVWRSVGNSHTEVSVPSVARALANAIAALTGTRIRQLPLSKTIRIY